jgi:AcrR family transcriptional regulator
MREARLARIVEAGALVFAERGWYGTTMRDVARASGTSLANVYHYVGGKDDLVYQVELRILEAAVASAQAAGAAPNAQARLKALLTDHVRRVLARPIEAEVLRGAATSLRGERARRIEELRQRYLGLVRLTVEGALRRKGARERDADTRAALLLGMADRLALEGAGRKRPPRPDRIAAQVLQVFLHGARTTRTPERR